jgi:sugar lactone lactonase YvrE
MTRRTAFRLLMAASALLAGVAVATPAGGQAAVETVATGLDNPRGLAFGPDGHLYVAEAGRGGDGPCFVGPEGPSCFGLSGAVTRIKLDRGEQARVLTGLPSFAVEGEGSAAIGPMDIAFFGSSRFVTFGLGADPALRDQVPALADMARVVRAQFMQNAWQDVADIGDYEATVDPNADGPDSNPNGLIASGAGQVLADSGGNSLLAVDRRGRISTIATFPNRIVPGPGGMPFSMDAVPTSVVVGPDGAYYVSQLTGFPFPVGGANIYRVVPGQAPQVWASGFTNVVDLAFAGNGDLLVVEIATNGILSGDFAGALKRVATDGTVSTVMGAPLFAPYGIAVQGEHAYVSNCGVCAGGGEVLRIGIG